MSKPELPITQARRDTLELVREGRVTYAVAAGRYCVNEKQIGGWIGRTLAELRRADYILILNGDSPQYTVDLTERGRDVLVS